jgi:hypothetical protein
LVKSSDIIDSLADRAAARAVAAALARAQRLQKQAALLDQIGRRDAALRFGRLAMELVEVAQ